MRILLIASAVLTALLPNTADARRHHRHHGGDPFVEMPTDRHESPDSTVTGPRQGNKAAPFTSLAPPASWKPEPPNPNWDGKRFLSPDGTSWMAVYKARSDSEPTAEHMKNVIFAPDETITFIRGERTWIAVSGFKNSRIFYRKAVLACEGKLWNHVAFEFPIEFQSQMEPLVIAAARALDTSQPDCGDAVAGR